MESQNDNVIEMCESDDLTWYEMKMSLDKQLRLQATNQIFETITTNEKMIEQYK